VKNRWLGGYFKVPPPSSLIRQMTRRPPIVSLVPGWAGALADRIRPHLVLLAAVNIHQLNARLNSQLIDHLCLLRIDYRLVPV